MRILLILPSFPYPADSGYRIKTFNLIRILQKHFEVEMMILQLKPEDHDMSYFEENKIYSSFFSIGLIEKAVNLIAAIFTRRPFQSAVYSCKKARKKLISNIDKYDYVVCSMIRTSSYIDLIPKNKLIVDMVDLLSKSYSKSKENTNSQFFKLIYRLEAGRLASMERYVAEHARYVLLVNKEEAEGLNQFHNNAKWIPNGVNSSLFKYNKIDSSFSCDIVFLGTMNYQPNIDAILWLDKYVLDYLDPKIRLTIIGRNPAASILDLQKRRKNVLITGYVEDPYVILNSSLAVVAPMQNGGGIQNKLLESMALGTINVVTSYAANPIVGAKDGEHFLVEDDPKAFARAVNAILSHHDQYIYLKKSAKDFICSRYTWQQYEDSLMQCFR